ncbi:MAG: type I restriction-modification system subunit M, partial [Polaromonas sp.]
MTSTQQRAALQRQIWQIANDVRGAVDGWDFKQYVLGTLFYRFISENFASYIEGDDESVVYAELADSIITLEIKDDAIKTKGYFLYPSQLFANVTARANTNERLNTDLAAIFSAIESSANGYPSELAIKGLFADFDTTSNRLGNTVADKNSRLAAVLKGVAALEFGDFDGSHIDLFGDAYEFLISNYAGKSGGEFFTPQHVSKLIAQLAMHKQTTVNKIYDPAAGSGSLLLQAKKHFDAHIIEEGFFGQELNHTTYNLARMNMFLHNINYDKFNIQLGDTLRNPHFGDDKPFDAIVSNPPYSVKWIGNDDPTLINDERFAPAGVLAPRSKADFAFVLHALSYLSSKGRAAIVCFPGIFYRGGAEQKIRQYLVDHNYVETVISLAPNLFYGTTIAVTILVLSKHKSNNRTQFIDASALFKKETNNNVLLDGHLERIMEVFDSKANIEHFARSVEYKEIAEEKEYNLSVSSYVQAKDTRELVEITRLNADLKITVTRIDRLRKDIDAIVMEIDGEVDAGMRNVSFLEKLLGGVEVEWKALGELGELVRGNGLPKSDFTDAGIPAIHYGQIYTYYGLSTAVTKSFVSPETAKKLRKVLIRYLPQTNLTLLERCLILYIYTVINRGITMAMNRIQFQAG